jgi:hypothetical protein
MFIPNILMLLLKANSLGADGITGFMDCANRHSDEHGAELTLH